MCGRRRVCVDVFVDPSVNVMSGAAPWISSKYEYCRVSLVVV
jgi:hypothetical protein